MFNVLTLHGSPLVADSGTRGPVDALIARLNARLNAWANQPVTSNDLLTLADSYEATQPSYAADLRAAAALQPVA